MANLSSLSSIYWYSNDLLSWHTRKLFLVIQAFPYTRYSFSFNVFMKPVLMTRMIHQPLPQRPLARKCTSIRIFLKVSWVQIQYRDPPMLTFFLTADRSNQTLLLLLGLLFPKFFNCIYQDDNTIWVIPYYSPYSLLPTPAVSTTSSFN